MGDDVKIRFGANNAQVLDSVDRIKKSVTGLRGSIASGLGSVGIGLGGAALIGYLKSAAQEIDNLDKRAKQLRSGVEGVQRLEFVSRQNKADVDVVADALLRMDRILGDLDKNKNAAKALERLNIQAGAFNALDVDERVYALADAYVAAGDKGAAFASLYELLGRQSRDLIPLLAQGGDALRELGAGLDVVSAANVQRVAVLNDRLDELTMNLRNAVVSGLFEAKDAADVVFKALKDGLDGLGDFEGGVDPLAQVIEGLKGLSGEVDAAAVDEKAAAAAKATKDAADAAAEYAKEQERAADALGLQQVLAKQELDILEQQLAAGQALAEQKAEQFAAEVAALEVVSAAEAQRSAELKKQSEEAQRLNALLNDAPYSDLRRIGGGYKGERIGSVSAGPTGGAGSTAALERVNASIEVNTQRTADAVQQVAAATSYSPEQDLRALQSIGNRVVGAVQNVTAAIKEGIVREATVS